MRFIRKGGRVIPINDSASGQATHAYKKTAALSAAAVFTGQVAGAAAIAGHRKSAFALGVAGAATGITNVVHQIKTSSQVVKASREKPDAYGKRSILGELFRHQVAQSAGSLAGNTAFRLVGGPMLRGMIRWPMYAKQAAQGLHAVVKPHTAAFAEARKFYGAKKVKSSVFRPTAGLLTHG